MEMTVPEIADELKIPIETVRSRLRLGRNKMRSLIAPEQTSDPIADENDTYQEQPDETKG